MPEIADVSVIIPVYRAVATIDRALASVAAQTVMPREIIIVDDGSDDGTEEKARTWSSRMGETKLVVFKEDHHGPGATRNKALSEASGTYVAFLDADDEWLPTKLEKSLSVLQETESDIVSHDYLMVNGDSISRGECTKSYYKNKSPFVGYFLRGFVSTSTVVARKSTLVDVGGFDPGLLSGQDYELWLVVLDQPKTHFHIFDQPLMRYHVTANSISTKVELRRQCALSIARRHAHRLKRHCRFPAWVLMQRILIIYAQAAISFLSQSRFSKIFRLCFAVPFDLISACRTMTRTPTQRSNFLSKYND